MVSRFTTPQRHQNEISGKCQFCNIALHNCRRGHAFFNMSRRAQRFRISAQKGKHAGNRRHTSSRAWKSRLGDPQIRSSSSSGMNIRSAAPPHTCCGKGHRAAQHSRPSSNRDASFIFPHITVFGGCEEVSKVSKSFGNTHTHTHTFFMV